MKKLLITLVMFWTTSLSILYAQAITQEQFNALVPDLKNENWQPVYEKTLQMLQNTGHDTSDERAMTLYVNIYAAAGMLINDQMSYEELEKAVAGYQGQKIIMATHPISTNRELSTISLTVNDTTNRAFTSAANAKGINIHCFEVFKLKEKVTPNDFPNKSLARCGGIIDKIESSNKKSKLWIIRLTVKDAYIEKME